MKGNTDHWETGPRTTSFTEYHEPKARRRDTIQSLVLDVHQIPFTKLEGCQPSSASPLPAHQPQGLDSHLLSPTEEDASDMRRYWSHSSSPQSADFPVTTRTFNFPAHPVKLASAIGHPGAGFNNTAPKTETHTSSGGNDDIDSEDQYAAKLCNASHHQSHIYSRYYGRPLCVNKISQSNTSLQKSDGAEADRASTRSDGTLMDPLDLVDASATYKSGRKLGHVNHVYVPDLTSRERSTDPRTRERQQTPPSSQAKTSKPTDDPIFYTKVPLETKPLFSEAPLYPTAVIYHSHNDSGPRTSGADPSRSQVTDSSTKENPSQFSWKPTSYLPLAKPEVFTVDNEPATQAKSSTTEREHFVPSSGFLTPATVKEEDEYYTERQQDMNSYLEPSPEELGMVRHFSETAVHTGTARTMFLKKRESLPVSSSSKHQRILLASRDQRPHYGSNPPNQDYYTPSFGTSVSRFQHYPYPMDFDSLPNNLASPDYELSPMIIPPMATNLSPFPFPTQPNDVFVQRAPMTSDPEHAGSSSGNERETPKRKSSGGKKPSLVSLVRGRRSDKGKGKLSEVKHNRSLSLNRSSGGSRKERLKTLQTQRSKEV